MFKLNLTPLFLLVILFSCNQIDKKGNSNSTSKSEFKDSTSFTKGTKVFVRPIVQMKIIDSVTVSNGTHYYFVGGKRYVAKDIKSLD